MSDYVSGNKFKKGNPGKPKGAKDKKTLQWEKLGEYLIGEGAERYMKILSESDDKEFKREFSNILEYFKPKQVRSDQTIKWDGQLPSINITVPDVDN